MSSPQFRTEQTFCGIVGITPSQKIGLHCDSFALLIYVVCRKDEGKEMTRKKKERSNEREGGRGGLGGKGTRREGLAGREGDDIGRERGRRANERHKGAGGEGWGTEKG